MIKTLLVKGIGTYINALSFVSKKSASKKALTLFSTPRQGQINEVQAQFLETSEKETLSYNELPIQTYRWKGTSNKTILLLHGWESNAGRWKRLIKKLHQDRHTVIAMDAPAHGNSGSKVFNAVLYSDFVNVVAQHFKPNHFIGHSVGGMTTVFHQKFHNYSEAEKLILLGAPSDFTDVFRRYTDMMGYNSRIVNGLNILVKEKFNKLPAYFSVSEFVKDIDTKGLLVHDKEDAIIPYSDAEQIIKNFKNAELKTTNGYGHGLKSKQVDSYILDFINS